MPWPKLSLIEPRSSFGPLFGAKTGFHEESLVLCKPFCVLFPISFYTALIDTRIPSFKRRGMYVPLVFVLFKAILLC